MRILWGLAEAQPPTIDARQRTPKFSRMPKTNY